MVKEEGGWDMKHNYNVHILRCVIFPKKVLFTCLLSVLYTLVYMSLSGSGASP